MIRRDMLKLGGMTAVGIAAGGRAVAAVPGRAPTGAVLYDERFAEGRAFAAAARAGGARAFATAQDALSLLRARDLPLTGLAGLTSYADMVVIAGLAAEARQGFAFRIAHVVEGEAASHRLVDGPQSCLGLLETAGSRWPQGLWSLAAGAPPRAAQISGAAARRAATLWSWAIA